MKHVWTSLNARLDVKFPLLRRFRQQAKIVNTTREPLSSQMQREQTTEN
jgi:hypothetical protein